MSSGKLRPFYLILNVLNFINETSNIVLWLTTQLLNLQYCHFDDIAVIGFTRDCENDNFWCSQWGKCHQNDDIAVSVTLPLNFFLWFWIMNSEDIYEDLVWQVGV